MKKLFFITLLFVSLSLSASAETIDTDCTLNGIRLYGRVQVVDYAADFRVQIVDWGMADLRVRKETLFASRCGEWQFVDFAPDFRVQFVDFAADFRIRFVDFMPGLS